MPRLVCSGAVLQCNMGTTPSTFSGGCQRVTVQHHPAGTIQDHKPNVHVRSFGLCRSLANPTVASATAAAQGALTPQPCVPNLPSPWVPGATRSRLERKPALTQQDKLTCAWAGMISVTSPGQGKVNVR